MTTIKAIERAVTALSKEELAKFRQWFLKREAASWDSGIEEDAASGKFDAVAEEALNEYRSGKARQV